MQSIHTIDQHSCQARMYGKQILLQQTCNTYLHLSPFVTNSHIIQERLVSVTNESMCKKYWLTACSSLPRTDRPAMTIAVDLGRKATKQTKKTKKKKQALKSVGPI